MAVRVLNDRRSSRGHRGLLGNCFRGHIWLQGSRDHDRESVRIQGGVRTGPDARQRTLCQLDQEDRERGPHRHAGDDEVHAVPAVGLSASKTGTASSRGRVLLGSVEVMYTPRRGKSAEARQAPSPVCRFE